MSTPRTERRPADLLRHVGRAAIAVAGLHLSLPTTGRVGSGTRRTLRAALDGWSALLQQAGAPPLPPSRALEEPVFVSLGEDGDEDGGDAPLPLAQYTPHQVEELGEEQGGALVTWVESAGDAWRARGRQVATAFGRVIAAVRRRVSQLGRAAMAPAEAVTAELRRWLRVWAMAARQTQRDILDVLGRFASGAGMGLVFIAAIWLWSNKRS